MSTERRWRLARAGALACSLACFAGAARATTSNGSAAIANRGGTFASYQVGGHGKGMNFAQGANLDGEAPEAYVLFETGGLGYARASLAWPGSVFANAGDTIVLASGGGIPEPLASTFLQVRSPVRAEARSPGGPPDATFAQAPDTMTAHADPNGARATGTSGATQVPGAMKYGSAFANSDALLNSTACSGGAEQCQQVSITTTSQASGVDIGAGVVKIKSVDSIAEAMTNGVAAVGSASTTVNGLTIAGQPATIDDRGLHLGTNGSSAPNEAVSQIQQQALDQAQIRLSLSKPTHDTQGSSTVQGAPTLLVVLGSGDNSFAVGLGGAEAYARGGLQGAVPSVPTFTVPPTTGSTVIPGVSTPPGPLDTTPTTVTSGEQAGGSPPPAATDTPSEPIGFFTDGNPIWLMLLGLGSAVLAFGPLRRLGDGITDEHVPCDIGGSR